MEVKTKTGKETQKIGFDFSQSLKPGDVIALYGNLGSGKTTFVQGLAKGLGIKKRILSPTFVFVRSYDIKIKNRPGIFHHIDLYRIKNPNDVKSLDFDELFSAQSIVAIEWADKIKAILPKNKIDIFFEAIDEKTRKISIGSNQ